MAYEIDFVDDSAGLASEAFLQVVKDLATANGWEVLRERASPIAGFGTEIIMKGEGLSGTEEIFVGMRCYQNAISDIYNIALAAFTGYDATQNHEYQPGYIETGIPAHNTRIDYWLTVNPQRIAFSFKGTNPVYQSGYVGKFFPYAKPSEYNYPMMLAGMLNGPVLTRFSDLNYNFPWNGAGPQNLLRIRKDGVWLSPQTSPYNIQQGYNSVATNGEYHLSPVEFMDNNNVYGVSDGIFHVTGYNNAVENTIDIDGTTYIIINNVTRTGFADFYALELS
jgi:hypothetical protein